MITLTLSICNPKYVVNYAASLYKLLIQLTPPVGDKLNFLEIKFSLLKNPYVSMKSRPDYTFEIIDFYYSVCGFFGHLVLYVD